LADPSRREAGRGKSLHGVLRRAYVWEIKKLGEGGECPAEAPERRKYLRGGITGKPSIDPTKKKHCLLGNKTDLTYVGERGGGEAKTRSKLKGRNGKASGEKGNARKRVL